MKTLHIAAPLVLAVLLAACSSGSGDAGDDQGSEPVDDDPGGSGDDGNGGGSGPGGGSGGGGNGAGEDCPGAEVALTDVIPTVLLLVDRSVSMTVDFGGTSRWDAVFDTLMNPERGLVKRLEQEVRFGLALYSSDDGFAGGTCPIIEQVAPALANYDAIFQLYEPLEPIEDTPTAASLAVAQGVLAGIDEPGPKIIVLATDGDPDTCAVPDPDTEPQARADSVAAAQAAHAAGIDTYVISVGNQVSEAHLRDLANAGVGLPVGGAEQAPFYRALDPDALVSAFDTIIGGVRSCSFILDGSVDVGQAERGTVTLDGSPLEHGSQWQLVDASTLVLLGDACETILAGGDHVVAAEFECGVVVEVD